MNAVFKGKKLLVCVCVCAACGIFSLAYANGKTDSSPANPDGTALPLPVRSKGGFFSPIKDQTIIQDVEKGTPASIRSAVTKLRQSAVISGGSVQERVLLAVATALYVTLYPAEKVNWEIPEVPAENPYIAIINSARNGVYEFNSGAGDYLGLVLPSLVLLTAPAVNNYYAEAQNVLHSAFGLNPAAIPAPYLLGILFDRQGKKDQALLAYERAYENDPANYQTSVAYAVSLTKNGNYDKAFDLAQKLLAQNQQNIELVKLCADITFARQNWKLADQYAAQVLQNDPNNQQYLLLRTRVLMELGEFLRASSLFEVYSRNDRTSRDYFLVRIRLQRDWNKNPSAAANTAQEALRLYPEDLELLLLAADLASQTGQKISNMTGAELAKKVQDLHPSSVQALSILVTESIRQQNWPLAYEQATRLVQEKKDEASQLLFVEASLGYGDTARAADTAKRLYDENPASEACQIAYIRSLIAVRNTVEASRLIESLLTSASTRMKSDLYYERSRIQTNSDRKLNDLRSSLTANPRNQNALFDLYQFYYNEKDYRKAQYYLKQVVAITPNDQRLLKLQAEIDNLLVR